VHRSISKPVSFVEFRVHVRSILDVETVAVSRLVGATGAVSNSSNATVTDRSCVIATSEFPRFSGQVRTEEP